MVWRVYARNRRPDPADPWRGPWRVAAWAETEAEAREIVRQREAAQAVRGTRMVREYTLEPPSRAGQADG